MPTKRHLVKYHKTCMASVDAMTAVSAQDFPRHTHDQYGIGVIDKGGHASMSDAGEISASPGNLILVNPGEVHDGRSVQHRERSWRMLYFEQAMIDELHADLLEGAGEQFALFAPVVDDSRIRSLFDSAFKNAIGGDADVTGMAFDGAILDMVAPLIGALGRRRPILARSGADRIFLAKQVIDTDPSQSFSLTSLASNVGISRFQLHRGFQREFGLPPHIYIIQQRVAVARQMLKAGHRPVDAALAAGFCDQSHLNRVFAQTFGASPGRYQ